MLLPTCQVLDLATSKDDLCQTIIRRLVFAISQAKALILLFIIDSLLYLIAKPELTYSSNAPGLVVVLERGLSENCG
jgi:hypothetical protein